MTGPGPVQVSDSVWWVGCRLADDAFQCHSYLILNGSDSVLLDPGSLLTIDETLANVAELTALESVRYLVCHHPDPDIAGALGHLSTSLTRPDVVVVTEWRARALLKHYAHRFDYWLIEDHGWSLDLKPGRSLQFQLTPYLHFPGAFMSYDTQTATLFSSDIFGGFVADGDGLFATDIDSALLAMEPFHKHYMPSRALLGGALARVRGRWPRIDRIAPQHGQVIDGDLVGPAFDGLSELECGVFALTDADHELTRLLRLSEARTQFTESLLAIADPAALVASIDAVLRQTHQDATAALLVDVPDDGWTMWTTGSRVAVAEPPQDAHTLIELSGRPTARLSIDFRERSADKDELIGMFQELATYIRPSVDQYVSRARDSHRIAALSRASRTDPLTNLSNRRALDADLPIGSFALIALDIDHFKDVNDRFGHAHGDLVLQLVSARIRESIREEDRAYRMGGEEFLVVAPRADAAIGAEVAERIRRSVATIDLAPHSQPGDVTISAGVSEGFTRDELDFPSVLARADRALYASKRSGRDRVTVVLSDDPD